MRRARNALAALAFALALCVPGVSHAVPGDTKMSSVGILDYSRRPDFKVGDYVRYLVTSHDEPGSKTDSFYLTVLIAGQEVWWGERCFWVEAWADDAKGQRSTALTLMSYGIFSDSLADDHVMDYERKIASEYDADRGGLIEMLVAPKPASLTSRSNLAEANTVHMDSAGVDTVLSPAGNFRAQVLVRHRLWDKTGGAGDSTLYKVLHEDHTTWIADGVPLTHSVRDETTSFETRKTWMIGHSKDAVPDLVVATKSVTARLVAYGHGLKPRLLPLDRAHGFDEPPAGAKPATAKPATHAARRTTAAAAATAPKH